MSNRRGMFLRAIRGPILLITIGILFAWQQAAVVSFTRTWPLILIVLGILKLLERIASPSLDSPLPPPSAGGYPR